ncbi:MAG TPA: class I SAM-dependent methyltransferase [Baekduia sp.]|uniref:class I SAM-dependent methyltransferase n=1 Tax=Baekduia sp. TaxID=2600305 RepID=UPI002C7C2ECE|nr:class I SAM-dependent methyltransferase [Baekduia sp.]HMJ33188.1 class I SAM-dependent methyltransferase [Baekduia sp.]
MTAAVVDRRGRPVAACERRESCAVCGDRRLRPMLELPRVPVHMGCTHRPADDDAFADQRWARCRHCGCLQLSALAPLDLVYQSQHNGAVGGVWARHHEALVALLASHGPRQVVEVGGASGALARRYVDAHGAVAWTVVEPNPTFVPQQPVRLVTAFVEDAVETVRPADMIVHSHLLEHLYLPRAFLTTMRAHARTGTLMVLSVPDLAALLDRAGANALNFEHTYYFGIPTLLWMLQDAGFAVEAMTRFERHSVFVTAVAEGDPGRAGHPPDADPGAHAFARFIAQSRRDAVALTARAEAFTGDVYLFGGHVFSQFLLGCGFPEGRVTAVLDNDPAKDGLRLYGTDLTVVPPAVVGATPGPAAVIVRAAHYTAEITQQLRALAPTAEIW